MFLRQTEIDQDQCDGINSDELACVKALERENKELKQANEILRKTAAFFA